MDFNRFFRLKGHVFIVTYGRSGSTLLQSLLQTLPNSHIVGENYNVLDGLIKTASYATKTKSTWGNRDFPAFHPWYGASKINVPRLEKRLAQVLVDEIICPPIGAKWIGFKEIRYHFFGDEFENVMGFLHRNFKNAFIVFNSRNAENVADSAWWRNHPRAKVLSMVADMDQKFARYAARQPTHAFHAFHDETIKNPMVLKPLFDLMGEQIDFHKMNLILSRQLDH